MILGQDVKLVPVNVQDSCGEVRVSGELTLEVIQRPAVKQVTAAALGIWLLSTMTFTSSYTYRVTLKHITHDILTPKTHLGGVHPLVKHRGVTQGVGAAVVQTPGQTEHLGTWTVNGL